MLSIVSLSAQIDYDVFPEVSSTYLISDVHIQKSPTDSFGLGDILIEDGYIKEVSRNIEPPVEAYVIEADSAYAYPAFIAGLAHTGISKKENKGDKPDVKFQGHPPNEVVGITPELLAHEQVSATDESIKKMKSNGFGLVHVVPRGTMLPGQGSLMLLEGESNEEMIYAEKSSMFLQLKGTRGFYPTTVIGVMAKWRDLYRKAGYLAKHQAVTKSSTSPLKRAKADKALAALIPSTQGKQTIYMKAEKAKAIHKAIALKKELGYELVLAEVQQAGPVLAKIKAESIPLLISAKLPKEEKDEKGKKGKDEKGKDKKAEGKDTGAEKTKPTKDKKNKKVSKDDKEDSPEVKALKERKKKSYEAYVGQAAMLEKEGIAFGFSFLDSKPEVLKKSLKRMMKAGLSEAGALAALTTHPAKILGIDNKVGTLAKGKLANLFISDAPFFSDDSNIKYVFVEGKMTEQEVKPKKKKADAGDSDMAFGKRLLGSWSYTVSTPEGEYTGTIEIKGDEDDYTINITSDDDSEVMEAREISVGEEVLSYVMTVDLGGQGIPATNELNFDGNDFEGTVTLPGMGSMPISGTKISGPE